MTPLVYSTGIVTSSTGTPQMWTITPGATVATPGAQRSGPGGSRNAPSASVTLAGSTPTPPAALLAYAASAKRSTSTASSPLHQQRALAGVQPAQPVAARVAEAARPVVVERVERAHLAVGVHLEARLLDAAPGAAVHARVARAAGDLPALVVRVVVGAQVQVGRERDVPHAADRRSRAPTRSSSARRSSIAGHDLGGADPGPHLA